MGLEPKGRRASRRSGPLAVVPSPRLDLDHSSRSDVSRAIRSCDGRIKGLNDFGGNHNPHSSSPPSLSAAAVATGIMCTAISTASFLSFSPRSGEWRALSALPPSIWSSASLLCGAPCVTRAAGRDSSLELQQRQCMGSTTGNDILKRWREDAHTHVPLRWACYRGNRQCHDKLMSSARAGAKAPLRVKPVAMRSA